LAATVTGWCSAKPCSHVGMVWVGTNTALVNPSGEHRHVDGSLYGLCGVYDQAAECHPPPTVRTRMSGQSPARRSVPGGWSASGTRWRHQRPASTPGSRPTPTGPTRAVCYLG
jgi:hypothetical protein